MRTSCFTNQLIEMNLANESNFKNCFLGMKQFASEMTINNQLDELKRVKELNKPITVNPNAYPVFVPICFKREALK
jgi:hypothetical protein